MLKLMLIAGCGGFVGTCARFLLVRLAGMIWSGDYPLGVFIVNIIGCFAIGLFLGAAEKYVSFGPMTSALLITGFCGGFTTFSTYTADILALAGSGAWLSAVLYLAGTIVLGAAALLGGRALMA